VGGAPQAIDDPQRLIHELTVHQIELEMQNETLNDQRLATEENLSRYTELYDYAPVGYVTLDHAGGIRRVNLVARALLNIEPARIRTSRLAAFIADESLSDFNRFLASLPGGTDIVRCEVILRPTPASRRATILLEGRANLTRQEYNVALIDITARREMEQRLSDHSGELRRINQALALSLSDLFQARQSMEAMAMHDQLTGLANRYKFLNTYAIEVERHNRNARPLSLMVIDIDYFKAINDRLGHLAGDTCLRALAAVLVRSVRVADLAGRFGGEEFVILLPDSDAEGAMAAADNLRREISNTHFDVDVEVLRLTVSIGVATLLAGQPGDFKHLMRRADRALYRAKAAGRNTVMMENAEDDTTAPRPED
jgi:diguanylate cyclase (GGDEF)-like protein